MGRTVRGKKQTVREKTRTVPTTAEVQDITRTLNEMSLGFDRKKHNKTKVVCANCGCKVRRDGLAGHKRNKKCARKAEKYNKKKHDGRLAECPVCKTKVVWGKMRRHQKSSRCVTAAPVEVSGCREASSSQSLVQHGSIFFHFCE